MAAKLNAKTILMWLVALVIPLFILNIPTTELFTTQMRTFNAYILSCHSICNFNDCF